MSSAHIKSLVPGGVRKTDHQHHRTYDQTCSRCRERVADGETPLFVWDGEDDTRAYAYCRPCQGLDPSPARVTCRICGCSDASACMVGHVPCTWSEPGLCSHCADARGRNGSVILFPQRASQ